MSDYEFYGQLVFYIVCMIGGWAWIHRGINKYVYNYDYPEYTED